jgi:hypothetical protein
MAKAKEFDERLRGSFSVDEWCTRHRITRAGAYLLWKRGEGPRYFKAGTRRLISVEADREWIAAREAATARGAQ